jgi:hypothetical protein
MTTSTQEVSTGRRVWWFTALILTGLILAITVFTIPGIWVARGVTLQTTARLLAGVNELAGSGLELIGRVDEEVARLAAVNTRLDTAVREASSTVSEQGLVRILLPSDIEEELVSRITRIRDTISTIRATVNAVIETYQTINRMPFVTLPGPDPEQVAAVQDGITRLEEEITAIRDEIQRLRDGKAENINRILTLTEGLGTRLDNLQASLTAVRTRLVNLQANTAVWQQTLTTILNIGAFFVSLQMAWVAYALAMLWQSYWHALYPPTLASATASLPATTPSSSAKPASTPAPANKPASTSSGSNTNTSRKPRRKR